MKKYFEKIVLILLGLLNVVLYSTCQIGLGAAVDVQPPVITLMSPEADALVRDTFIMKGSYSDDLSVSGVTVVLKEVPKDGRSTAEFRVNAEVSPGTSPLGGTWACSINPKELGIKDGTYVATVTAMDTYLHTGIATQTFSIDNTAPLIVLTSPSSKTLANPTSYGQIFSVEGKAADDSDVDSIDAIIYDSETKKEIARKTITNVSTQIQIDVATWGLEDGFYEKIYGNNREAGTKTYELGLIAYDGARKVPAIEGDRGNATSVFYMNNDFAEIAGFKTSIAYNILNGTRSASDSYASWKIALDEKKVDKATFSLNPVNNPYFDVQNYEPLNGGFNDNYNFMNNNKLTVNLYVGRDKKAIKTETIGIYLVPCNENGEIIDEESKITLFAPYKDKDGNVIGKDNTIEITQVGSTSYRWSSGPINVDNEVYKGLEIGGYYLFDVVAYDHNGICVCNDADNKYGIKIITTSAAPILSITEPGATKLVASSANFYVKGIVKTSAEIKRITAYKNTTNDTIQEYTKVEEKSAEEASKITEGLVLNTDKTTVALKWYNFSFKIPEITDDSYSILIEVEDSNGQTSSKEVVVTNDKEAPEFDKNASITPYVDVVEKDDSGNDVTAQKVNGTINISQLISDDTQVDKVWYFVGSDYPEETNWVEYTATPKTTLKIKLDTTQYTKDKRDDIKVYLKAKDKAGNYTGNDSTNPVFISLNIDQSTDAPQIKLTNLNITDEIKLPEGGFEEEALLEAKKKATKFSENGTHTIWGSIIDDDGIDTVEVFYCEGSSWNEKSKKQLINEKLNGLTTYSINKDLPKEQGEYLLKFVVKDTQQDQTGYSSSTISPFLIVVDDGAPTLDFETKFGQNVFYSSEVKVEGKIDDSSAKIYRFDSEDCSGIGQEIYIDNGGWTDTITIMEEKEQYEYWYKAVDSYGQESRPKKFNFSYDPTPPKFSITEIQGKKEENFDFSSEEKDYSEYLNQETKCQKYGNLTDYFTVQGTVKDDWKEGISSGLGSYFYYYVGKEIDISDNPFSPLTDEKWKTCTITEHTGDIPPSWEAPISFNGFNEGDVVFVCFAAVDNAGNVSSKKDNPSTVLKVLIDGTSPRIENISYNLDNFTIEVKSSDNESGINVDSATITRNGSKIDVTPTNKNEGIQFNIKDNVISGENIFKVFVKDNAGNSVESDEITIDSKVPVFSNKTTGIEEAFISNNCSYVNEFFETTATINCEGTNNELGKVYYSDVDSEGNVIVENTELEVKEKTISISESTDADKAKYEGKIVTRTVIAENIYGIKSEPWSFTFNADFTPPSMVSTTVDSKEANYDGWFNKTTLSLNGTCTDENSGISYVTYKLGENEGEIYPSGDNKEKSFAANIGGFAEGRNTLNLSVTDNAGNTSNAPSKVLKIDTTLPKLLETVAPDAAAGSDVSAIWYRFKDESGESNWEKLEGSILTNVTKDIELTGAFEDKNGDIPQSGVKNISISVNSKNIPATMYEKVGEEGLNKWYADIPVESLENVDSECKATVSIVDNAENEGISKDVIFQIDTEAPKVTVEMPSKGSVLNGNNIFSGRVVDTNSVQSIELFYLMSDSETAPTNFTGFTSLGKKVVGENDVSLSDVTSWKFEKNVNELLVGSKVSQQMFILPVAYDKAGNNNISGTNKLDEDVSINGKLIQVTVDKHSDRPIIKFTNLSSSEEETAYINASTLNASVEDDDGISEVKVIISETEPTTNDWNEVGELPISSGGFKVDLGAEGKKTIWFYIKDSAGGEFTTKAAAGNLKQPYLLFDGSEDKQHNSKELVIIKDTQVPTIDTENLAFGFASTTKDDATTNVKVSGVEVANKKAKLGTKNLAGGTKRKFIAFEVPASDGGSGVDSVKVVVTSEDKTEKKYSCELSSGKYYSEAIDVKEEDLSGIQTVTFRVKDKSGLESTSTKQIIIDNTAPTLEVISPLPTDEVTGVVTLTGTTNDDDSNIAIVKYLVLNDKYVTDSSDQTPDVEPKEFGDCENKGSSLRSWKFELNNLPTSDAELNAEENGYTNITHTEQNIYTLPIYFYVEDELGNGKVIKDKTVTYNPFGDRPKAEVTYPTGTSEDKANVNGAIRVTGSASDNVSVKEVYIQLDVNNDGNFNNDDITILDACLDAGTTGNKVYTIVKSATDYKTGDAENADMSAIRDNFWGIKVNGTNSWNYTINKFSELLTEDNKVAGAEGKYAVNIIAVAVDNNYKFGNWSDIQYVEFDTNIPTIGTHNKNVLEYDAEGSVKATKAYIPDMYLKGKVDLELSVEDKEGIKQVMYYVANTEEGLARATGTIINNLGEEQTWGSGATETKGYIVKIPLAENSRASGTKYVKVVATKDSDTETTAYEKFSVNFDNSAPVLNHISLNGVKYADSDKKVVNSNGNYFTFAGSVTDEGGSGFDKLVFYYYRTRKDGSAKRIYNPLIDSLDSDGKTNNNSRMNVAGTDSDSMTIAGKTIYGSKQTATIATDKRTITLSQTASSQIRGGGLVNIAGSWITIKSVSGTTVELKSDSSVTGSQSVFFAYAQVIDNTGSEKTDANGNLLEGEASGDDGDGMAESILKYLTTWTCDATFRSRNIPDGPGKFVVFAFDKAGNVVSSDEYDASVQNNAPRLTRVMLATDLNGDGKYQYDNSNGNPVNDLSDDATANGTEYGEFAYYSTLNAEGNASNEVEVKLPTGRDPFIVKNNLLVVPEFVGGNGDLSYTYKIAHTLEAATITKIAEDGDTLPFTEAKDSKIVKQDESEDESEDKKVVFKDSKTTTIFNGEQVEGRSYEFEILNGTGTEDHLLKKHESWTPSENKGTRYLAATFWDSTEETTPGDDSCYALLKMPIIINVIDNNKPTANIIPFYWNSKEDSSFVYDDDGNPLGHIDIPTGTEKPGVSGEVYIEGYAWDDTRLGGIWMTTPGANETYQVAKYEGGNWSKVTTDWPTNWKDFEILEDFGIRQSGHTVKWRFRIDMTPYGLDEGKSVIVKAIDAQTNEMDSFTKENTINNITTAPTYIMDFVPYIKSIYSEDIGFATRSRLGKFPVRAGDNMIIEGMNFASGATYKVKFYKSNKLANGKLPKDAKADSTEEATFVSDGKIRVTAPQYSRWVEVEVTPTGKTTVSTKNNGNENGGYNIESGYVAKANDKGLSKANAAGTNFWTDDRYISVWNNTALTGSINPWDGTVKQIRSRDTKNGSFYKNISGNAVTEQSNTTDTYYAGWSSPNMMIYSTLGNGAATNVRTLYNNSQASFVTPVETVDIAIIGGLPWYVFNDNYVGGSSANTWGAGLMVAREGYNFPKQALNGTNTISDSENLNIVERQGSSTAADSRDSSNGYDSVLHQFKNPKITGWYDGISVSMNNGNGDTTYSGTVYVYVSYYDSYARCLKYAAFTEGWSNGSVGEKWGNINGTKNFQTLARAANNHKTPTTVVAGVDRTYDNPTDFSVDNGEDCGEWSDIMVDPTSHVPVIIYYNKTKGTLEIAQGKSNAPSTANYKASAAAFTDTTEGDNGWYKTKSITPKNGIDFGRYVSAEIDSTGNIHASAMDTTNGKLYYIFLKKDGTSYTPTYQIVDSTSAVGMWTDIQLGKYEADTSIWNDYEPIISYLDKSNLNTTKAVKVAYVSDGTWESISDPAVYEAYDKKTNSMCNVYETTTTGTKAKIGVSFNSSMLAVDFLRGE